MVNSSPSGFKPAPFRRPSVAISAGPRRVWRWIEPSKLNVNDIVPGVGLLSSVTERVHREGAVWTWSVYIRGGENLHRSYIDNTPIWAFSYSD